MKRPGRMTRLATSICMVTGMLGGMYSLNVMASGELTNSEKLRAQIVSFEEAKPLLHQWSPGHAMGLAAGRCTGTETARAFPGLSEKRGIRCLWS
ncbi:hypothetical protein [Endozoicomonas atrinae]|uniref:hypothetical protein n=1 Tax=Endozoicomonas atrinae TaxID=1333660 RepID=UPI003B0071BB